MEEVPALMLFTHSKLVCAQKKTLTLLSDLIFYPCYTHILYWILWPIILNEAYLYEGGYQVVLIT